MTDKKKGTGLRFVPVNDFALIPKYLIEQIEPPVDPDRLFAMNQMIAANPLTILGVFSPMDKNAEDRATVKGFLWATINPLTTKLDVQMLSLDEEYQGRGFVGEVKNILMKIREKHSLDSIIFRTVKPEIFEKAGAVRSDVVTMEVF